MDTIGESIAWSRGVTTLRVDVTRFPLPNECQRTACHSIDLNSQSRRTIVHVFRNITFNAAVAVQNGQISIVMSSTIRIP